MYQVNENYERMEQKVEKVTPNEQQPNYHINRHMNQQNINQKNLRNFSSQTLLLKF